jgi:hypothetical protein
MDWQDLARGIETKKFVIRNSCEVSNSSLFLPFYLEVVMQFGLFEERPHYETLSDLIDSMMAMDDDPLANAGTNVVICRGNPQAKLMIIGEAPGPEEDRQGKPFVGRSGQLLDKILDAAGFDPEQDVFISNSVFRMPPGEGGKNFRKPTTEEIEYYYPTCWRLSGWWIPRLCC